MNDAHGKLALPLLGNLLAMMIGRGLIKPADVLALLDDAIANLETATSADDKLQLELAKQLRKGIERVKPAS